MRACFSQPCDDVQAYAATGSSAGSKTPQAAEIIPESLWGRPVYLLSLCHCRYACQDTYLAPCNAVVCMLPCIRDTNYVSIHAQILLVLAVLHYCICTWLEDALQRQNHYLCCVLVVLLFQLMPAGSKWLVQPAAWTDCWW